MRKVSANALKHNGPAKRDPSRSMSDPVPRTLQSVAAGFPLGPAASLETFFIGRLVRFGSAPRLLDHVDSKRVFFGLVIANLVGLLLALMLLVFLQRADGSQFIGLCR